MPPASNSASGAGRLARCVMCSDFFLTSDPTPECDECLRAVLWARAAIESRGGSLLIVEGRIEVRTAAQLSDPVEYAMWSRAVSDVLLGRHS